MEGKEGLVSSRLDGDVAVVSFNRGRIRDEREILKALESLGRYIESRTCLKILLDLGNIEYLSSAGLGHLVGLLKKCRTRGGNLKLSGLNEAIRELFEVMRLDRIFELFPNVGEAVESFKEPCPEAETAPSPAH